MKDATECFFERFVATKRYETFISLVVIDEINRTNDRAKRDELLSVIKKYELSYLSLEPRADLVHLAEAYVRHRIIPRKKFDDALHVALCTLHSVDVLVSWNFQHLANVAKEQRVEAANRALGYTRPLRITTPLEVMGDD
jgi:predicted nucleic acid-binding protein